MAGGRVKVGIGREGGRVKLKFGGREGGEERGELL